MSFVENSIYLSTNWLILLLLVSRLRNCGLGIINFILVMSKYADSACIGGYLVVTFLDRLLSTARYSSFNPYFTGQ